MSEHDSDSSTHWVNLIALQDLEPKDATAASIGKLQLAVFDTDDGVHVTDARCTHAGAQLCDGYFDGRFIECPLHQGLFDIRTGAAKAAPVTRALKVYKCRVHADWVQVILPKPV